MPNNEIQKSRTSLYYFFKNPVPKLCKVAQGGIFLLLIRMFYRNRIALIILKGIYKKQDNFVKQIPVTLKQHTKLMQQCYFLYFLLLVTVQPCLENHLWKQIWPLVTLVFAFIILKIQFSGDNVLGLCRFWKISPHFFSPNAPRNFYLL